MSSKREEERNEKIIRGLLKLPPNRKCINCNSLGPQYVCTNFWTFVCITCSGIHREFTHRVKSVSMSKFSSQEVEALEKGGNQRAREIYLKDWDMQRQRFPESSNVDKIREFIKSVYVDKKYYAGVSSDKPPRNLQNQKGHEEEIRASSYHSYSQSPPYDHQYEDRRYGRQSGMLSRKPGSDRVHYDGKYSGLIYSPGRGTDDRFSNDGSAPRLSDYSVSSAGEASRHDGLSPNFGKEAGYSSPPGVQVRNILIEDGRRQTLNTFLEADSNGEISRAPRSHRPASSESVGSLDSSSPSLRSLNSGGLVDAFERDQPSAIRSPASIFSTAQISSATPIVDEALLGLSVSKDQQLATSSPTIDLFAEINNPALPSPFTNKESMITSSQPIDLFAEINNPVISSSSPCSGVASTPVANEGWASFDIPQNSISKVTSIQAAPLSVKSAGAAKSDSDPWMIASQHTRTVSASSTFQQWNVFDDIFENSAQSTVGNSLLETKPNVLVHMRTYSDDSGLKSLEDHGKSNFPGFSGGPISVESVQLRKSTNPFDFPCETELTHSSAILDMTSLQGTLPNSQFPSSMPNSMPWFPQFSVPPVGGLAFMAPPSSQLQNLPPQSTVASPGGNPFA